jgi:hypothetical protein
MLLWTRDRRLSTAAQTVGVLFDQFVLKGHVGTAPLQIGPGEE